MILKKELEISGKKKNEIVKILKEFKFTPIEDIKAILDDGMLVESEDLSTTSYDYLLSLPMWSLSHEKIEDLKNEKDKIEKEFKSLELKGIKDIWKADLKEFLEKYDKNLTSFIDQENQEYIKVAMKGRVKPMDLNPHGL